METFLHICSLIGISVSDVDARLHAGMVVELNISVCNGTISLPNVPLFVGQYSYTEGPGLSLLTIRDTVTNVNAAVKSISYRSPYLWNGPDLMKLSLSDLGGIGYGGKG